MLDTPRARDTGDMRDTCPLHFDIVYDGTRLGQGRVFFFPNFKSFFRGKIFVTSEVAGQKCSIKHLCMCRQSINHYEEASINLPRGAP